MAEYDTEYETFNENITFLDPEVPGPDYLKSVPITIFTIGVVASHMTLVLVMLIRKELRTDPLKWLVLSMSTAFLMEHLILFFLEMEWHMGVETVFALCEVLYVMLSMTYMVSPLFQMWIAISALWIATRKAWNKLASIGFILGGAIFSLLYSLVTIFGVAGGFQKYGERSCEIYYHSFHLQSANLLIHNGIVPLAFIIVSILLGVFLKKASPENKDYYRTTLITIVLYTVLGMPERMIWWFHTFFAYHPYIDLPFTLMSKLGFVIVALVWLFVPKDMREGYKKVCCCCCPKEEKDDEKVELLK